MTNSIDRLKSAGIAHDDAVQLRRISMQLHRWYEQECSDGNDFGSWCIARGKKENGEFVYDDDGSPFVEYHSHTSNKATYRQIPDRERGEAHVQIRDYDTDGVDDEDLTQDDDGNDCVESHYDSDDHDMNLEQKARAS